MHPARTRCDEAVQHRGRDDEVRDHARHAPHDHGCCELDPGGGGSLACVCPASRLDWMRPNVAFVAALAAKPTRIRHCASQLCEIPCAIAHQHRTQDVPVSPRQAVRAVREEELREACRDGCEVSAGLRSDDSSSPSNSGYHVLLVSCTAITVARALTGTSGRRARQRTSPLLPRTARELPVCRSSLRHGD